jgi:methylmalonyl-CoA mutase
MADDTLTPFSSAFPEADEAQWRALVEKALKGKGPEALERKTRDGLTIKPLYRESDWHSATDPSGLPGEAPFVRGITPRKDTFIPWDIRQVISHPDLAEAHKELMKDLERGVTSIELRIDSSGENGVAVQSVADLTEVLDGVLTDLASIALTNSALEGFGIEGAALLAAWSARSGAAPSTAKFAFNVDPIGELARSGALPGTLEQALSETAAFAKELSSTFKASTFIRVDGRPAHETGGSEAQELAFTLASGVTYLRALLDSGLTLEEANKALLFTLSVGPDYALEIAKLKGMRRLWAKVTESFGGTALPMQIQAVSSRRMLTQRDPWVNMLRNTAACFAAGVGGADVVTLRPFTDAIGLAASLGRRLARNTQIMAQEESSLGKVADPAGGAWSIGKLSDDMAQTAWALFQSIESEGGIGASLQSGSFQTKLAETRNTLRKDIAKRKQAITGVSEFALIDELKPPVIDLSEYPPVARSLKGSKPASRSFSDIVAAAKDGSTLSALLSDDTDTHATADPLFPIRLSEPFEQLRDHADAQAAKTGKQPAIFLACLGPIAKHNARASFAVNFFAAGGIAAIPSNAPYDTLDAMAADFKASGALLAIICGADDQYAETGADAARALRIARDDTRIYVAGKPGDMETGLRAGGVDDFIFVGVDLINKLEIAHAELGLG